uniref:Uncharacterized protein n=1 Tax=Rhizophora mucronata TaxID=61149 RepID=A0A2P2PXJ6_RHIMU
MNSIFCQDLQSIFSTTCLKKEGKDLEVGPFERIRRKNIAKVKQQATNKSIKNLSYRHIYVTGGDWWS